MSVLLVFNKYRRETGPLFIFSKLRIFDELQYSRWDNHSENTRDSSGKSFAILMFESISHAQRVRLPPHHPLYWSLSYRVESTMYHLPLTVQISQRRWYVTPSCPYNPLVVLGATYCYLLSMTYWDRPRYRQSCRDQYPAMWTPYTAIVIARTRVFSSRECCIKDYACEWDLFYYNVSLLGIIKRHRVIF